MRDERPSLAKLTAFILRGANEYQQILLILQRSLPKTKHIVNRSNYVRAYIFQNTHTHRERERERERERDLVGGGGRVCSGVTQTKAVLITSLWVRADTIKRSQLLTVQLSVGKPR